jgi:predicted Zn-ribbon and HTH transcriptional regulator
MKTIRKGKINRHEKITILLLSGKPVSPREIFHVFEGTDQEAVLYRLSTNIYNIRKDGGVIKVHKAGRKVSGYQLLNPEEFNQCGRYVGKPVTPVPVEETEEELETA